MISIIVPIYNMEKLLDRCIQSILEQSYQDFELILIDDGSTDRSLELCQKWAEQDSRIIVKHKKNGGQASARNLGLDIAKGDYIGFVDSDDWIDADMYKVLLSNLLQYDADISCCCNSKATVNDNEIEIYNQPEIMLKHVLQDEGVGQSPCDKLFKKEMFFNVRFPLLRAYEDCATIFKTFAASKKVIFQRKIMYHYETRPNSTMTQTFSSVKFQAIDAYYEMYKYYQIHYSTYEKYVKKYLVGSIQYCIGETLKLKKEEEYQSEIVKARRILKEIGRKGLALKQKISSFLILRMFTLYGKIYKLKK